VNAAQVDKEPLKKLMGPNSRYMHCTGDVQNWLQIQKTKFHRNNIFRDKCNNVLVDYDEKQVYVSGKHAPHVML
jgi:hypothetical protein